MPRFIEEKVMEALNIPRMSVPIRKLCRYCFRVGMCELNRTIGGTMRTGFFAIFVALPVSDSPTTLWQSGWFCSSVVTVRTTF